MSEKQHVVDELHRPARINFRRQRVILRGLDDMFQADLVEMIPYARENKGFRYILVVINAFSKFVWAVPVKRKTGQDVAAALEKVLKSSNVTPKNLQTDLGKEFYNKHVQEIIKKYNINHYSVYSTKKASIVERVNRTLKSKMWKRFSFQGSHKWLNVLPEVVKEYNNTVHRTIGMRPNEINRSNEKKLLSTVYSKPNSTKPRKLKFKEGDFVRISKHREAFAKGYTPNWSNEIFKIVRIKLSDPIMYYLQDSKGQNIEGGFYELELQRVKYPDVYLVEKILRRKGNMVYVKWLGLDKSHNSWIHKSNVVK